MWKKILLTTSMALLLAQGGLMAHCQMPCGIYHDEMVYGQIDQYVETMYKGISVLNNSKFSTTKERNEFIRWVIQKERASDDAAQLINGYFLQQKIQIGEESTTERLISAHKLLFLIVGIKQNTDLEFVEAFSEEWDKFKLMFHREGYACDMERINFKKDMEKNKGHSHSHDHGDDHSHSHDHEHHHDHAEKDYSEVKN